MLTLLKKYFLPVVIVCSSFVLLYAILFNVVKSHYAKSERKTFEIQCKEAAHKFTYRFLQNDLLGSAETMGQANERIKLLINDPQNKEVKAKLQITLDSIREKRKANLLYVLNKEGTALVSSSKNKTYNIDGKNYKFRPYFQKAVAGQSNVYAAVGIPSMVRGVYYSAPVYATYKPDSKIIGDVTFKMEPKNIINYLEDFKHLCFLVSSSGIIFATSDPGFLYKRAFEVPSDTMNLISKNKQFPLDFFQNRSFNLKSGAVTTIYGKKYVVVKQEIPMIDSTGKWSLFFLKQSSFTLPFTEKSIIFLFTLSIYLISFTVIIAYSRRKIKKIRHQKNLEQAVESYKTTFDTIHEAILSVDINTKKILDANKMAMELYGYRLDQFQEKTIFELNASDDQQESITGRFFGSSDDLSNYVEWLCKRRDGSTFWASVGINFTFSGKQKRIFLSIRNINKQKEAEQMLLAHQEQLEALNKELQINEARLLQTEKLASTGQLAAGVAHEINNPLSFVYSNLGSMKNYTLAFRKTLKHYHALENMLKSDIDNVSVHIQRLIEQIDKLEKKEKMEFIMEDVDSLIDDSQVGINRVKEIVSNLRQFAQIDNSNWERADINKGIISTIKIIANEFSSACVIHEKLEPVPEIECNLSELNQAVLNILQNAIQAQKGKGDIYIKTCAEGNDIVIKITDTGPGIPEDILPRIFDPFYTTKDVGKGTGLGLSMTYEIIKKHRGTIHVESRPGHTAFLIKLPIH